MSDSRTYTLEELDALAEEGAARMVVGRWGEDLPGVTHRRCDYRQQRDGTVQMALFSLDSNETWYVAAGYCTCPWWTIRCQRIEGAGCKHQRFAFPGGEPRPEIPVIGLDGRPVGEAAAEAADRARRREQCREEIEGIFGRA